MQACHAAQEAAEAAAAAAATAAATTAASIACLTIHRSWRGSCLASKSPIQ